MSGPRNLKATHGLPQLTVGAAQIFTDGTPSENYKLIREQIREAAGRKVDLLVFPEAALSGYSCAAGFTKRLDAAGLNLQVRRVQELCRRNGIAVALPTAYRERGHWHNGIVLLDRDGAEAGRYVKTFHAGEKWAVPRHTLCVYTLCGIRVCCIVCHDIRYPELVRLPVIAGARLVIFASNESGLTQPEKLSAYHAMPIARATENGVFLIMANAPAVPEHIGADNNSHGESKIIAPTGQVLASLGHFDRGIVSARIDLAQATAWVAQRVSEEASPILEWVRAGRRLVREGLRRRSKGGTPA